MVSPLGFVFNRPNGNKKEWLEVCFCQFESLTPQPILPTLFAIYLFESLLTFESTPIRVTEIKLHTFRI